MTDIKKLHEMVWELRAEINATWASPTQADCLRYSVTEAGEALDAWLRLHRQGDARNHFKPAVASRVLAELADCAMMLLSAVGPEWGDDWRDFDVFTSLDDICGFVGVLLFDRIEMDPHEILHIVSGIARYPGMNLETELDARLVKIRAKHTSCVEVL